MSFHTSRVKVAAAACFAYALAAVVSLWHGSNIQLNFCAITLQKFGGRIPRSAQASPRRRKASAACISDYQTRSKSRELK
jgi:hypothetical protein